MIDLENLTGDVLERVLALLPTIVGLGTYYKNDGNADYDPVTDNGASAIGVVTNVRMIRTAAVADELIGTTVTVDDVKILIPAKDLPNIIPGTEDELQYPGVRYDVIKIKKIPVKTLHILYCRAK